MKQAIARRLYVLKKSTLSAVVDLTIAIYTCLLHHQLWTQDHAYQCYIDSPAVDGASPNSL
jgi:hypothetical protein